MMYRKIFIPLITGIFLLALFFGASGCRKSSCEDDPEEPVVFNRLVENQVLQSHVLGRPVKYAVLLPADYDKTTIDYPVVFLLHGFGESETGWYKGGYFQYYLDRYSSGTIPMIYVMPEGYNSYYVNRYNGSFDYMDMFVDELVPAIDSLYRTQRGAQYRAVMGYSMGGYGALILPAKHPEVFKTGVVLSMSFRTDEQYMAEPQGVFDLQWGSIFGGSGSVGEQRITEYYKEYSPFHFMNPPENASLNDLALFLDCGDDEETLSITNNALHSIMREQGIPHEYRVRNGAHTWDYWHSALPEALRFIGCAVRQIQYPDEPDRLYTGLPVPESRIKHETSPDNSLVYNVVLPEVYSDTAARFPLIIALHDRTTGYEETESQDLYSLLAYQMDQNKCPQSLVVEIPVTATDLSAAALGQIIDQVRVKYRVSNDLRKSILLGNGRGGAQAWEISLEPESTLNGCLLFDASLPANADAFNPGMAYYLYSCDKGDYYKGYNSLYASFRQNEADYEFRIGQGVQNHRSFLNGLYESYGFMNQHLTYTGL